MTNETDTARAAIEKNESVLTMAIMTPRNLLCLILLLMFLLVGCEKKLTKSPESAKQIKSLHRAATDGDREQVRLLISKGAHFKTNALHVAAEYGQKDVAELLIAKGADINAAAMDGTTPLQIAKDEGNKEIVELLRKHRAKE